MSNFLDCHIKKLEQSKRIDDGISWWHNLRNQFLALGYFLALWIAWQLLEIIRSVQIFELQSYGNQSMPIAKA